MKTRTMAAFAKVDGKLVWEERHVYQLQDTGCIFIAYKEADAKDPERNHMVYKLTKIPHEVSNPKKKDKPDVEQWFWAGLWNSCVMTCGIHGSMQDAIETIMKKGYVVKRTYFSELCKHLDVERI